MADDNASDIKPEKQVNSTQWKPGQSGNPNGRPKKGLAITDIMREMLEERPEIRKALSAKLFELALKGDLAAIREVMDRLEGRPLQPQSDIPPESVDDFLHIYKPEKKK